jgi:sulfur relay (sulfurtransferase) complex TusBCD TusD component (DsrE family)
MKNFAKLFLALFLALGVFGTSALAGDKDPLFINLTTDDAHRVDMAIMFSGKQLEKGHPLTIFLNDRGTFVGSVEQARFTEQQKALNSLMAKGATVIICPMCAKYYGMKEGDFIKGIKVGSPDVTGAALFKDNTQTLTW